MAQLAKYYSIGSQAVKYINKYYNDTEFNVAFLAREMGLSASYLSTVFKAHMGENLSDVINRTRVERAKQILDLERHMTLNHVATQVGFASETVLNRAFKKYTGITPGIYRKISGKSQHNARYPLEE